MARAAFLGKMMSSASARYLIVVLLGTDVAAFVNTLPAVHRVLIVTWRFWLT
jgi:hypothetical protein